MVKQDSLKGKCQSSEVHNSALDTFPLVPPFPYEGNVRAKQIAQFLSIGLSSWWLFVKQKRVDQPMRYGSRVSVWPASYIRSLQTTGIPAAKDVESRIE